MLLCAKNLEQRPYTPRQDDFVIRVSLRRQVDCDFAYPYRGDACLKRALSRREELFLVEVNSRCQGATLEDAYGKSPCSGGAGRYDGYHSYLFHVPLVPARRWYPRAAGSGTPSSESRKATPYRSTVPNAFFLSLLYTTTS